MPSNPNKEDWACRKWLDLQLTRVLERMGQMEIIELEKQALLNFPVSRASVRSWINDYYIEPGLVKLNSGTLERARLPDPEPETEEEETQKS